MRWSLLFTGRARRDLRRLDPQTADRVLTALQRLAETGQGDVIRLQGAGGERHLRVGDWRIRFEYDREANVMRILRVLPRGRAYRD